MAWGYWEEPESQPSEFRARLERLRNSYQGQQGPISVDIPMDQIETRPMVSVDESQIVTTPLLQAPRDAQGPQALGPGEMPRRSLQTIMQDEAAREAGAHQARVGDEYTRPLSFRSPIFRQRERLSGPMVDSAGEPMLSATDPIFRGRDPEGFGAAERAARRLSRRRPDMEFTLEETGQSPVAPDPRVNQAQADQSWNQRGRTPTYAGRLPAEGRPAEMGGEPGELVRPGADMTAGRYGGPAQSGGGRSAEEARASAERLLRSSPRGATGQELTPVRPTEAPTDAEALAMAQGVDAKNERIARLLSLFGSIGTSGILGPGSVTPIGSQVANQMQMQQLQERGRTMDMQREQMQRRLGLQERQTAVREATGYASARRAMADAQRQEELNDPTSTLSRETQAELLREREGWLAEGMPPVVQNYVAQAFPDESMVGNMTAQEILDWRDDDNTARILGSHAATRVGRGGFGGDQTSPRGMLRAGVGEAADTLFDREVIMTGDSAERVRSLYEAMSEGEKETWRQDVTRRWRYYQQNVRPKVAELEADREVVLEAWNAVRNADPRDVNVALGSIVRNAPNDLRTDEQRKIRQLVMMAELPLRRRFTGAAATPHETAVWERGYDRALSGNQQGFSRWLMLQWRNLRRRQDVILRGGVAGGVTGSEGGG